MKQVHLTPRIWKSKMQSRISCLTKKYYITIRTKILQITVSHDLKDQAHFGPWSPKTYSFQLSWICIAMQNSLFIPFIHSWDKANFRVPWIEWPHLFFTMPIQKWFNQLLIFVSTCKNSGYFIHLFWRYSWF